MESAKTLVAQAFEPAGFGDFPVARSHGTGMSRESADRNVCATTALRLEVVLRCTSEPVSKLNAVAGAPNRH